MPIKFKSVRSFIINILIKIQRQEQLRIIKYIYWGLSRAVSDSVDVKCPYKYVKLLQLMEKH